MIYVKRSKCEGVPKEIISFIKNLRPYKEGDTLLWAINDLCNTSKHRRLVPCAPVASALHITHLRGRVNFDRLKWDANKKEIILFEALKDNPVDFDIAIDMNLAFGDFDFIGGRSAVPLLREMESKVSLIITGIDEKARQLGLTA